MKKAWYLQTWFISLLISMWFLVIPGIIGIILLILSYQDDKEKKEEYEKNENIILDLNNTINQIGAMEAHEKQKLIESLNNKVSLLDKRKNTLENNLESLKNQIIITEDELLIQSFGLYTPKYEFMNSDEYKNKLDLIRKNQKQLIRDRNAASGNMNWNVNGNAKQGKKMVQDMQKLLLRAFNIECDGIINRVKYNNFDISNKRIFSSYESVSKLGKIMNISITREYLSLKYQELSLALEYQQKKQAEKEEQQAIREQMKEEAKLQKDIEEARNKANKERKHFIIALNKLKEELKTASGDKKNLLMSKKSEIENNLNSIEDKLKDIDYRESNQKAGYVYIISNIGSFGENKFKIGMSRRLVPEERVYELGGASVPFHFDIHAMIFSENAPALENSLHKAFENKKINMVNKRKEFFNVRIEEIKNEVYKNYDKTIDFKVFAEAEEFRVSKKMKEENNFKNNNAESNNVNEYASIQ